MINKFNYHAVVHLFSSRLLVNTHKWENLSQYNYLSAVPPSKYKIYWYTSIPQYCNSNLNTYHILIQSKILITFKTIQNPNCRTQTANSKSCSYSEHVPGYTQKTLKYSINHRMKWVNIVKYIIYIVFPS